MRGRARVWLFLEARSEACVGRLRPVAQPDVTEPCGRVGGGDADRDEVTLLGDQDNLREGAEERIGARDHVVSQLRHRGHAGQGY